MTEHIKTLELSPPTCTLHYFRSVYVRDDTLKITTSKITLEGESGGDAGKYGYLINRGFTFYFNIHNYLHQLFARHRICRIREREKGKVINKGN
jgi:hypothetical protein